MQRAAAALLICAAMVSACTSKATVSTLSIEPTSAASSPPRTDPATPTVADDETSSTVRTSASVNPLIGRPFDVAVPSTYDGTTALPLLILLHGFGITGEMQDDFFHFRDLAESRGFLMASPDGTRNADGSTYWNASDACCGFSSTVDDSSYLAAVIQQVLADYAVDAHRVFLIGFSNGGFMSYRMACDHADLIAGIVSISAATFLDSARCAPSEPVSVVEIHGTDDATITYQGGEFRGTAYPGAEQTVAAWAAYNGCAIPPDLSPAALDLERTLTGDESSVTRYHDCSVGGAVELWTVAGGEHVPEVSSTFSEQVIDYLLAHPKP